MRETKSYESCQARLDGRSLPSETRQTHDNRPKGQSKDSRIDQVERVVDPLDGKDSVEVEQRPEQPDCDHLSLEVAVPGSCRKDNEDDRDDYRQYVLGEGAWQEILGKKPGVVSLDSTPASAAQNARTAVPAHSAFASLRSRTMTTSRSHIIFSCANTLVGIYSGVFGCRNGRLTFAITGSKKRGDEGAPLFTVRVDGVMQRCSHAVTPSVKLTIRVDLQKSRFHLDQQS